MRSQGQIIDGIRPNVTAIQNSVTGLRGTLTTNVKNLDARINDHVDRTQDSLDDHSQTLNNFESQMHTFGWKLARLTSDAAHAVYTSWILTFECHCTVNTCMLYVIL